MSFYYLSKILHIISFISWMVALLYLPRLFIYNIINKERKGDKEIFIIMQQKLIKIIMLPAMISTVIFGLLLISFYDLKTDIWIHIKLTLVIILIIFNFYLIKLHNNFKIDNNKYSVKFYKILNEVPTIIMIIIVILAVTKPF